MCPPLTAHPGIHPRGRQTPEGRAGQGAPTILAIGEVWLGSRGFAHVWGGLRRRRGEGQRCSPWSGRWRRDPRRSKLIRWGRRRPIAKTCKQTGENTDTAPAPGPHAPETPGSQGDRRGGAGKELPTVPVSARHRVQTTVGPDEDRSRPQPSPTALGDRSPRATLQGRANAPPLPGPWTETLFLSTSGVLTIQ